MSFRSNFMLCVASEKQKIKIFNRTGGFKEILLPSLVTGVLGLIGNLVSGSRN